MPKTVANPLLNGLRAFLNEPINTVSRERMFFNRLFFELKLAAAVREYALSVFEPEADRDGYDVVLDDGDLERRFQLKAATATSGTSQWKITKRLLLPPYPDNSSLGFETSPDGVGLGGGAIVTIIEDSTLKCDVRYFYTDIYLIDALRVGLIAPSDQAAAARIRKSAEGTFEELRTGDWRGKVNIGINLFIEMESADKLLAIAGFHSAIGSGAPGCYQWWTNYFKAVGSGFRLGPDGYPEKEGETSALADSAAEMLMTVIPATKYAPFASKRPRDNDYAKVKWPL